MPTFQAIKPFTRAANYQEWKARGRVPITECHAKIASDCYGSGRLKRLGLCSRCVREMARRQAAGYQAEGSIMMGR